MDSVLLISDDSDLALVIRDAFAARGFRLAWEPKVERGLVHCLERPHRGLLLDAVMKSVGAPQLVGWLRSRTPIPIVVLSTVRQPASLHAAFESGADDWIVGPFDPDEVALRVCAVLRRSDPHRYRLRDFIGVGDIQIATASRLVRVDGCVVGLTSVEYDILEYLVREVGRVVSRDELMGVSCHRQASPLDRSVDVHISHLRRKLRRHGSHIRTVRGIGYMMASAKPDGVDHDAGEGTVIGPEAGPGAHGVQERRQL
jgi:two-component system, OmpR family, response regulator CpxR